MTLRIDTRTILVVDDSQLNQRFIEAALQSRDYLTRSSGSGQDALALLKGGLLPDLILLDVSMPDMDGFEVCRQLKADPRTRNVPVIFLTGRSEQESEVRGFEHGAVDYITKPISIPTMLARVRTHLENARLYEEKNHVAELLRRSLSPRLLTFPGLEVGHRFVPSKLLSGDFYDLVALDEERLGVVMADVAGKGPDAAIQTVRAKYLIRAAALSGRPPAQVLDVVNQQLDGDDEARSVTAFYAEVNARERRMTYCNAGHEPPLLWQPGAGRWRELTCTAALLGAIHPLHPEQESVQLEPGACLVMFTDGVTEARSPGGKFLGSEPLIDVATRCVEKSAQDLIDELYAEALRFCSGQLSDDLSLLALRFL